MVLCPKCLHLLFLVSFLMSLVHQSSQTVESATRTSLPVTPPLGSSNFGSPKGSVPDLDGMDARSSSTVEGNELDEILLLVGQIPTINLRISLMDNHFASITHSWAAFFDQVRRVRTKPRYARSTIGSRDFVRLPRIWFSSRKLACA